MIHGIKRRISHARSNLDIRPILKLVWTVSPKNTITSAVLILIETGLFFTSLYLLKLLVDSIAGSKAQGEDSQVLTYIVFAAASGVLHLGFKSLSAFYAEKQSATIAEHINDKIHERTIALDLAFYESPDYFDVLNRAMNAGAERPAAVINTLFEITKTLLSLAGLAIILISIDWLLLPLLALFVVPTLLVHITFADKFNAWRIKQTPLERKSEYYSSLITTEQHAKEVRSYNLGDYIKVGYMKIRIVLLKEKLTISKARTGNELITSTIAILGFFSCLGYIILSPQSLNSVGDITIFLVIFPQSFHLLQALTGGISTLYQHNIFIVSIFDLLKLKPSLKEPDNPEKINPEMPLNLTFNNVCFSYPQTDKAVLKDVSFQVKSRQIIAIVGMNGAGKTSLIKLLCRFYDPQSGYITMDGKSINSYSTDEYRKQIGMVFQDYAKYQISAADNIHFGDISKKCLQNEIELAAQKSGANKFIERLPLQYENVMGNLFENGQEVSIGQWQKLAIARCLYSDARLLVFDEATSALDAQAEKAFFDELRTNIGDRAAIIISHRHSAVKNADHIYVLSDGRISQSGTDKELLMQEGDYAELFANKPEAALKY